jgi:hypothetical protein
MQRMRGGLVKGRLVVGDQWMIVIFASEAAMQQFVETSGSRLIEENQNDDGTQG